MRTSKKEIVILTDTLGAGGVSEDRGTVVLAGSVQGTGTFVLIVQREGAAVSAELAQIARDVMQRQPFARAEVAGRGKPGGVLNMTATIADTRITAGLLAESGAARDDAGVPPPTVDVVKPPAAQAQDVIAPPTVPSMDAKEPEANTPEGAGRPADGEPPPNN